MCENLWDMLLRLCGDVQASKLWLKGNTVWSFAIVQGLHFRGASHLHDRNLKLIFGQEIIFALQSQREFLFVNQPNSDTLGL